MTDPLADHVALVTMAVDAGLIDATYADAIRALIEDRETASEGSATAGSVLYECGQHGHKWR